MKDTGSNIRDRKVQWYFFPVMLQHNWPKGPYKISELIEIKCKQSLYNFLKFLIFFFHLSIKKEKYESTVAFCVQQDGVNKAKIKGYLTAPKIYYKVWLQDTKYFHRIEKLSLKIQSLLIRCIKQTTVGNIPYSTENST